MNSFTKTCPKCDNLQTYSCKSSWQKAVFENRICVSCTIERTKKHYGKFERVCKCGKKLNYSCRQSLNIAKKHNALCRKCATKKSAILIDRSFQRSISYRIKMSNSLKNSEKHKKMFTEEVKEKLRVAKLKQIRTLGTKYTYNPFACRFIENFGKQNGYNFQHAMNGGEVMVSGYSLDGYDKDKNVVFEYDEPKHHGLSVKMNDLLRQTRIIKKISPSQFIRYDELNDVIYDVISGRKLK